MAFDKEKQTALLMHKSMLCLTFAVSVLLYFCSGKPKERPQEASYQFDINQELGYNWNYTMVDVHNKNFNNKTYKTYNTVDNYKVSDNEEMGAFFLDLASQLLLKESLGLAEIFARHGYIFKKGGEMENYFKKQSWYTPRFSNVDKYLSDIEKKNISTIKTVESQRS